MTTKLDFSNFHWINQPKQYTISNDLITIFTDPGTDFWQRTYYDFQHENAHAFVIPIKENKFSFMVKVRWEPKRLFDQCGVILYLDADNWFKASVEYDNKNFSRLGSVVTNLGYSDWATTDVEAAITTMTYRLSRRGRDFQIENSNNGQSFSQMRIFHVHRAMEDVKIGIYACSPLISTMKAEFDNFCMGRCEWEAYTDPDESSLLL